MPEENFQSSSFIPKGVAHYKKPKSSGEGAGGVGSNSGALLKVAIGFATLAGLLVGAAFFYTQYLDSELANLKQEFAQAQSVFEPEIITELENIDQRISSVSNLLKSHTAVSPVFDVIESVTLSSVQLINVSISSTKYTSEARSNRQVGDQEPVSNPDGDVVVSLIGLAPSFAATALQSEVVTKSDQLINPRLSRFNLNEEGDVGFVLRFTLPTEFMSYEANI